MTAKIIDPTSAECMLSELELFRIPSTQTSIDRTQFYTFNPVTSPDRQAPLDFIINGSDLYIDPSQIWLYTKSRILDDNGTNLPAEVGPDPDHMLTPDRSVVYPVNNFHASRFKALDVHLNGRLITPSDNLYPYRAYLETLLTYRPDVAEQQLQMQLYHVDTGNNQATFNEIRKDELVDGTSLNKGAVARFNQTKFSRPFETMGKLHFGLANQPKLLPPQTELKIKLTRADNKFALMAKTADKDYIIQIEKAVLYVQMKHISNHVQLAHEEAFLKFNAKYPIIHAEIRYFTKAAGLSDLSENNIITNGQLPLKVVTGILSSDSVTGLNRNNPFCFIPAALKEIALKVNSVPLPYERIQVDFESNCYSQGYFTLLQATRRLNTDKALQISYKDFAYGNTLYAFDLQQDFGESEAFNLRKDGNLSLNISLNQPTPVPTTLLVYMEYLKMIEIDSSRNVQIY